jgi:hypothetical protein
MSMCTLRGVNLSLVVGPPDPMFSPFASTKIFCVPLGAGVHPTSVLHKRRQLVARLFDQGHIPQRPRPLADCLVVRLAIAGAANDCRKLVRVFVD